MNGLSWLSAIVGWIYFAAWTISFYPQLLLNYQLKRVDGLAIEYQLYNFTGFLFYSVYNILAYEEQHRQDLTKSVEINDIAFAVHAFLITILIIYQIYIYRDPNHFPNFYHVLLNILFWIFVFYNIFLSAMGYVPWYDNGSFSTLEFLGYIKAAISFVKYVPQVYRNYRRKSTVGWSMGNVLLDLTGGTFSFFQQFIDANNGSAWDVFTGNVPKLFLAVESIMFDIVFIFQHFVLYRHRDPPGVLTPGGPAVNDQTERLLPSTHSKTEQIQAMMQAEEESKSKSKGKISQAEPDESQVGSQHSDAEFPIVDGEYQTVFDRTIGPGSGSKKGVL